MDIFPNKYVNASNHFTRNSQNHSILKGRLQLHKSSFVPIVGNEWNELSTDVHESNSIFILKEKNICFCHNSK